MRAKFSTFFFSLFFHAHGGILEWGEWAEWGQWAEDFFFLNFRCFARFLSVSLDFSR